MRKRLMLLLACLSVGICGLIAQVQTVTGIVISEEDGEPVVGASVLVKGTTIGTITDINGNFNLPNVPGSANTLQVSYIGLIAQEVAIKSGIIQVRLKADAELLDEIVVIAYGTTTKKSFTGSASTIGTESLDKRILTSATSAIEGNSPGVQVTAAAGQPGESPSIRIRGFGSVNASNAPLYIVDGAVYNGDISNINPADIESMTILKDAASTSLYGSSAGNGVVLITTKRGTGDSGSVTLNITQGWSSRAYNDIEKVNIWEYYPLQWEMYKNAQVTSGKTQEEAAALASKNIVNTLKYNPFSGIADGEIVGLDGRLSPNATKLKWGDDLDWEDEAFGNGYRQEYNLSYNSKGDKSNTYSSIAYLDDKGYMLETDFQRISGRINHNITPTKWFKSGVNLAYTRVKSNYSTSTSDDNSAYNNLTRYVRTMAPIYPVHKHDLTTGEYLDREGNVVTNPSQYVYDYDGSRLSNNGRDAIAETKLNNRQINRSSTVGRTYLTITPLQGLSATMNYAIENVDYRRKVYENPYVGDGTAGPGRMNIRSTCNVTQTFNQLINYNKEFGKHRFDLLLGHESYSYKYEYFYSMKTNEVIQGVNDLDNFVTVSSSSSYTHRYNKEGYFTRANYDYDNKYYASVSYRRDGSSRFSKDNRWGNFWSFGASWRVSEEEWMKDITWINNLKIRASYGETGNDAILDDDDDPSYYPYQNLYELGINNSMEGGVYFMGFADPTLKWEKQISSDIAVEFELFNRLSGTLEFFNKESSDLLFPVSKPLSTGVTSVIQNIGKSRNRGVELDLNFTALKTKDWRVNLGANVTWVQNEITKLPAENRENGIIDGSKKLMEGKSIYEFWLRQWYGVNPANGDGLYYMDMDAYEKAGTTSKANMDKTKVEMDGKVLTNSYSYAKYDFSGSAIPDIMGGFNFKVAYKSFELGAVFSYQLGGELLDYNIYGYTMSMANYGYSMHKDIKKAWRQPGDITDVPRLDKNSTHSTNIGQTYSTRWLVSSDYLNMRSLTFSYAFPKDLLRSLQLNSLRLTFSAENLFMIKARQGLNPLANFGGITYHEYMPARTYTLGLNLSF